MNDQPVLELKNCTKRIGSKTIIDQLSLEVPRGEVFGFLGPNGAGKTTTIRMIVGLMSCTEGEILVNGISVTKNFEQAMTHIGAIVENPELYKFLTGYQNLVHYARMVPGVTKQRIDEVVELVGMKQRIHDKVKTYSLGMRQRLGVAQAILHKPSVLILDEPTNGLDPAGIRELRDYLRNLAKEEGTSILVSSHLLSEMELMCDRVAIIQNGKLIDVTVIKEENHGQQLTILFETEQAADGAAALLAWNEASKANAVQNGIIASLTHEQIPDAIARLVQSGTKLYGVRPATQSLEDTFLEMTRGEQIV